MGGVYKKIFEKIVPSLIPTEKDETATLFPKKLTLTFLNRKSKKHLIVYQVPKGHVFGVKIAVFLRCKGL